MKLAFLPGELFLNQSADGLYRISLQGREILCTRSRKTGIQRFNELRQEMERRFPQRDLSNEQKAELLQAAIADSLVGDHTVRPRKKTTAKSTRTFG